MHAMAKMAKNRQPLAIWIRCQKWPLGGWRFGENGDFGKNRQRAGDNGDKRPGPLKTGDFGENGNCGEIGDYRKKHQCGIILELDAKSGPSKYITKEILTPKFLGSYYNSRNEVKILGTG